MIGAEHTLALSATLFAIGLFGVFHQRRSALGVLVSVEVMLLAAVVNLVAFSSFLADVSGHVLAIFVLLVSVGHAAVGIALLMCFFKARGTADLESGRVMKG
ncbi:MAG: NADH-quinone oxidoreductase subunit NuoK [Pseudomonadota bacterium]